MKFNVGDLVANAHEHNMLAWYIDNSFANPNTKEEIYIVLSCGKAPGQTSIEVVELLAQTTKFSTLIITT